MAPEISMVSFRPGDLLEEFLPRMRPGIAVSFVGKRDAARYYKALPHYLVKFPINEARLILQALNGILCEPDTLWGNLAVQIRVYEYGKKYGVEGEQLLDRIDSLGYMERCAVLDAVERAWVFPEGSEEDRVRAVGLVE